MRREFKPRLRTKAVRKKNKSCCRLTPAHCVLFILLLWLGGIAYHAHGLMTSNKGGSSSGTGVPVQSRSQGTSDSGENLALEVLEVRERARKNAEEFAAKGNEHLREQLKTVIEATDCSWEGPFRGYLAGCPSDGCSEYRYFWEAQDACVTLGNSCGGITAQKTKKIARFSEDTPLMFEVRHDQEPQPGPRDEWSYVKNCASPPEPYLEKDAFEIDARANKMIDGRPTIFVGIASYRDHWCSKSLETGYGRAKYPNRIFFGVSQQNAPVDKPCLQTARPCDEDPEQVICKYRDNIRITEIDAADAKGPVFGRHFADLLYEDEYYALQVDAHMIFINNWDEIVIEQFNNLNNDYAILSTYPSDIKQIDSNGNSKARTAPIICKTRLLHTGMIKHEAAGEMYWPRRWPNTPMLGPFLGAGVIFSRGHRIIRVPYDCCLDWIFDGEEFSLAARAFTWGYDFYAPSTSFSFHPYSRKDKPPMFWENKGGPSRREKQNQETRSQNRIKHILGLPVLKNEFDEKDLDKYGTGPRRPLDTYYNVFGLDMHKGSTQKDNCNDAFNAVLMDNIHVFIRKDGRGIDYRYVRWHEHNEPKWKGGRGKHDKHN